MGGPNSFDANVCQFGILDYLEHFILLKLPFYICGRRFGSPNLNCKKGNHLGLWKWSPANAWYQPENFMGSISVRSSRVQLTYARMLNVCLLCLGFYRITICIFIPYAELFVTLILCLPAPRSKCCYFTRICGPKGGRR